MYLQLLIRPAAQNGPVTLRRDEPAVSPQSIKYWWVDLGRTRTISDTNSLEIKNIYTCDFVWLILFLASSSLKYENVECGAEACLEPCQTSSMELFFANEFLIVFDHFVGLALKGPTANVICK